MQMKCKNHPNREAGQFCASCGIPICDDCAEEVKPGQFFCFQCAMLQSVSQVGTSLVNKRERAQEKKLEKKKREWGPFQYFMIISSVLIVVMWGVILFGGKKPIGKQMDISKNERVFLFMVDSYIKRYANHHNDRYPDSLKDMVPKYLPLRGDNINNLGRLSYTKDTKLGYQLSLANTKPNQMKIVISAKGITYEPPSEEGT
jgi:hypothetical protein